MSFSLFLVLFQWSCQEVEQFLRSLGWEPNIVWMDSLIDGNALCLMERPDFALLKVPFGIVVKVCAAVNPPPIVAPAPPPLLPPPPPPSVAAPAVIPDVEYGKLGFFFFFFFFFRVFLVAECDSVVDFVV